jgi:peroxiredoxin
MAPPQPVLKPGDTAPPFTLRTSAGQEISWPDRLHSGAAIVVFIRGTW